MNSRECPPFPVTSLIYYLTEGCNLNCWYCYLCKQPNVSDFTVGKAVVDFLLTESGDRKVIYMRFFGGEPLLELELLRDTAAYARHREKSSKKSIHLEVVSNCLLLNDEVIDTLKSLNIRLMLSIDGNRSTMEQNRGIRFTKKIFTNFEESIRHALDIGICKEFFVTLSPFQTDIIKDIAYLRELGELPIAVTLANGVEWTKTKIVDVYRRIADYYIDSARGGLILPLSLTNKLLLTRHSLMNNNHRNRPKQGCPAGKERLGVSAAGELFLCHRLVQKGDRFKVGNVFSGINENKRRLWVNDMDDFNRKECQKCDVYDYCQHSCIAVNLMMRGNPFSLSDINCFEFRRHMTIVFEIYDTLMAEGCEAFISFLEGTLEREQKRQQNQLARQLDALREELNI
jgi:uncharacterized protein